MADLRNYDLLDFQSKRAEETIAEIRRQGERHRHLYLLGFFLVLSHMVRIENDLEPFSVAGIFVPTLTAALTTLLLWGVNRGAYGRTR